MQYPILIQGVKDRESGAMIALYDIIQKQRPMALVYSIKAQDIDDRLHNTFISAVYSIDHHQILKSESLSSYLISITKWGSWKFNKRQRIGVSLEAGYIESKKNFTINVNPEVLATKAELKVLVHTLLSKITKISPRRAEIAKRLFILEQTPEEVQIDMHIANKQTVHVEKLRAKQDLAEAYQRHVLSLENQALIRRQQNGRI